MSELKEVELPSQIGSIEKVRLASGHANAIRRQIRQWGRSHYQSYPWRNPRRIWHGLIAEVLLSRTHAKNVVPVYERFIKDFPEIDDLKGITQEDITEIIYPLGLRWRAPLVKKLCDYLITTNGVIPNTLEGLLELPAVGQYVAAAMLSLHSGRRAVLIDANVVRFFCRLVDRPMDGETRRKRWLIELAEDLTPHRNISEFNYALLDFTMTICVKKPECHRCPLGANLCLHGRKVLLAQGAKAKSP